ncbi:diacylglycerol kinase family protein [Pikeienuella sp. HZG-20]|uniref:diacylglycerol kinase family protein n=1 Tax=Paludibacillus litoralis TaxID=3133267 RepID=UPI0030EEA09A
MPFEVGHIRNRAATRAAARAGMAGPAAMLSRSPDTLTALTEALAEMKAAGVRRIIIEGGDGTVREVLSRALPLWGDAPPEFAICATGNTNLIARSGGRIGPEEAALIIGAPEKFRRRRVPVLKVERAGETPIRGFMLGAGAYAAATKMAREEIGARHGAQVALAVLRLIRSPRLRASSEIGFSPGAAAPAAPEPRLLVALTSLPAALILGLSPFWGAGEGAIRWLDIAGDPPHLALAAPFIAFGAPRRWMRRAYRSGRAETAALSLDAHFVLDGEHFAPGADGDVTVSAAEAVTFLSR